MSEHPPVKVQVIVKFQPTDREVGRWTVDLGRGVPYAVIRLPLADQLCFLGMDTYGCPDYLDIALVPEGGGT